MDKECFDVCNRLELHIKDLDQFVGKQLLTDTHYIMNGSDVIAVLNKNSIPNFIRRIYNSVLAVEAILKSEKIPFDEEEKCINSLRETVGATGNIKLYKRYILARDPSTQKET